MASQMAFDARIKNTFIEVSQMPSTKGLRRQQSDGMLLRAERFTSLMEWSAQSWSAKPMEVAEPMKDEDCASTVADDSGSEACWSSERSSEDSSSSMDWADAVDIQSGLPEGTVTVMVRRVPHKYTQKALMHEISAAGFHGTFDCFYLPLESRCNRSRGFAFINFKSARAAEEFHERFDGQALQQSTSGIPLEVVPAEVQGMEAMVAHFESLAKSHEGKPRARGQPYFVKKAGKAQ